MEYEVEFIRVSAGRAGEITAMSPRNQRNGRDRGWLDPLPGDGRHWRGDVCDLAQMLVIQLAGERLPVKFAAHYGKICAKAVAIHALKHEEAWDVQADVGTDINIFRTLALALVKDKWPDIGGQGLWRGDDGTCDAAPYFVIFADGSAWPSIDLNQTFMGASSEELDGAVVVLALREYGDVLMRRAGQLALVREAVAV